MNGLQRNTARLFPKGGKLLLIALDHPQSFGVMPGLERPFEVMRLCSASEADGFILNPGMAGRMGEGALLDKKLVLRTSLAGSLLATSYPNVHENVVSPETALGMGSDAVIMMLVIGGEDSSSMRQVGRDIDAFHRLHIPCIVEILAADFEKTATLDVQMHGARIAAELGADVVKAFFVPEFRKVVEGCPVPVILAGGPKDREVAAFAREAVVAGVRGFAFGRNVFQHADPLSVIRELDSILRP
jgi:DhnA family fructose-bisphosphate aldolase class Ia